jgi:hypothetical protein
MKVLALDLATCSGFAVGDVGDTHPHFGVIRFGAKDCTRKALFGDALRRLNQTLITHQPDIVAYEEPLHFGLRRGASQAGNDELAYGLPAIVQGVAFLRRVNDIREVRTVDVRRFFIGDNPKREIGKRETMRRCRELGLQVEDDNAADAVAIWFFVCAQIEPAIGLHCSPLFGKSARVATVWP